MANKKVVFVRAPHVSPKWPWMFFHFDPNTDIKVGPVELVYFDYPNGVRQTWKSWTPKRGNALPPSPDSSDPLAPVVEIRISGTSAERERPSVVALYDWVKGQSKDSILSLQVFSHGYYEGPILWKESFESVDKHDLTADRDPHDSEFRTRDFFGKNPLAGSDGKKFADAFVTKPFIKLWGCNEGQSDPDTGEWRTGSPWRGMIKKYMTAPSGSSGDARRKANMDAYLDAVELSFQYKMASKLDLPVWAGPLGWGSIGYETEDVPGKTKRKVSYKGRFPPNLKKEQWWRMSAYFREQRRYSRFYTDVLKVPLDATFFAEMRKAWLIDARKLVTVRSDSVVPSPLDLQRRMLDRVATIDSVLADQDNV